MNATTVLLISHIIDQQAVMEVELLNEWLETVREENDELTAVVMMTSRIPHVKIRDFYENWIPQYLDNDFFALFRMNKETFRHLLNVLQLEEKNFVGGHQPIPRDKCLLMTLWWLGKGEVLLSVADKFNVAVSSVYISTEYVLAKLINLISTYIVWPDEREAEDIETQFRAKSGYPGVIGAVDVCNIKCKPPKEHQDSYIDKNSNHSIKLQAIVTYNKIFTNINVGFPGSAHDSRIFRNSSVYVDIMERGQLRKYFYGEAQHILGDKAYPLLPWVMTPYRDNGRVTVMQRHHNTCHSKTRIVVEHTFGLLKSRWRILRQITCNSIEKTINVIAACCILHNFCFINSDFWDEYDPVVNELDEIENGGEEIVALNKRNEITNLLWQR